MVNAAKYGGEGGAVQVFLLEVEGLRSSSPTRPGLGFDLDEVPANRMGVRGSITAGCSATAALPGCVRCPAGAPRSSWRWKGRANDREHRSHRGPVAAVRVVLVDTTTYVRIGTGRDRPHRGDRRRSGRRGRRRRPGGHRHHGDPPRGRPPRRPPPGGGGVEGRRAAAPRRWARLDNPVRGFLALSVWMPPSTSSTTSGAARGDFTDGTTTGTDLVDSASASRRATRSSPPVWLASSWTPSPPRTPRRSTRTWTASPSASARCCG
ncbi:hypothetical protein SMICM304S_08208 [Streptomyces microflavus]